MAKPFRPVLCSACFRSTLYLRLEKGHNPCRLRESSVAVCAYKRESPRSSRKGRKAAEIKLLLPFARGRGVPLAAKGGGNSFSYSRICRVPPGRKSIVCSRTQRPERATKGRRGAERGAGVDKLKWSGASALAINKAACREDRAYTCFPRIRSPLIFIEN